MKKIMAILMCVLIFAGSIMPVAANNATATTTCTTSANSMGRGDIVTVTVSLSNCANFKSMALTPIYDSNVFELASGEWLLQNAILSNFDIERGNAAIAYSTEKAANGDIFKFTLKVKENAPFGETSIKANPVVKNGSVIIECQATEKTVTVNCSHSFDSNWSYNANQHWKECKIVGCGSLIDKAPHSGGEATCVVKAVCSVCGVQYGEVNASNHKHTEVRDAKAATCCEEGYTGDTWCTDCNTKISTGTVIPATGNHVDADGNWETDGTNHWHTCYFGTKFNVTVHTGGEATCTDKAICTVCGTTYGELDGSNHKGSTYLKEQRETTCYEEGYTGDIYCGDCDVKIKDGTVIAKSAHNPASVWSTDENDHWKECQTIGCGNIIDRAPHSGGEATCTKKAICSVCNVQYGEVNASNHKHTEIRDAKAATEQEKGYSGDTWCLDCNKKIAEGKEIDILEHKPVLVKAEAATSAKEGNIEYYYCENCGKYYSDEAGTMEIAKEATVIAKVAPKIIDGNNAKIDKASKESVSFRSDAAFTDFIRVELDGKELVRNKDYTLKEGSIIVTLTPEFVTTLPVGEHILGIVSISGTAIANFTVTDDTASNTASNNSTDNNTNKSLQTGDDSNIILWALISIISPVALCIAVLVSKKKKVR